MDQRPTTRLRALLARPGCLKSSSSRNATACPTLSARAYRYAVVQVSRHSLFAHARLRTVRGRAPAHIQS